MKITLFTADISAFDLPLPLNGLSAVVPINRCIDANVEAVCEFCRRHDIPVHWQQREDDEQFHESEGSLTYPGIYGDIGVSWFYTMPFPPEILNRFHAIVNFKEVPIADSWINCFWHIVDRTEGNGPVLGGRIIDAHGDFEGGRNAVIAAGKELFCDVLDKILGPIRKENMG
jgi:hypothetical protein